MLKEATVAIEDRRFYQHGALDYQGIIRAAIKDAVQRRDRAAGRLDADHAAGRQRLPARSSIARPRTTSSTRSSRPSSPSSWRPSTPRTGSSTNYLNDVPYGTVGGQTAYGVGAASQMFFDKPVSKLSLAQVALLAGLPQAPSEYNPFIAQPGAARQRRNEVLQAMVTAGYITQAQANARRHQAARRSSPTTPTAVATRTRTCSTSSSRQAAHDLCPKTPNNCPALQHGGLKIYTTHRPAQAGPGHARRSSTTSRCWPSRAARHGRRGGWPRSTRPTGTSWRMATSVSYGPDDSSTTPPRPTASPDRRSRCSR